MVQPSKLIPVHLVEAASIKPRPQRGWDEWLVAVRPYLPWFHFVFLVFFLLLFLLPPFLPEAPQNAQPWNDLRVLANYLIWGLWFPLVFISVVVTGRTWCGVFCPMGAASEWANRRGLQRSTPGWIKWPGTPVASFILVTILGQTTGVRDHPEAALEIFGGTFVMAVIVGAIWGRHKRVWCRHMCPIGLLLGVFSRLGSIQLIPKRAKPGGDRDTEKTICPTYIDLARKSASRHCIECLRCLFPGRRTGLTVRLRRPGEEIEYIARHHPDFTEVCFLFLGSGIALGGFLWLVLPVYGNWRQAVGTWFIEQGQYWIGQPGPWWLMSVHPERREVFNWLDFSMITSFMVLTMLTVAAFMALATLLSAWLAGGNQPLRLRFTQLGYLHAPVALVSLVIGLATELFAPLEMIGASPAHIAMTKQAALVAALLWSCWLAWRILAGLRVNRWRLVVASPALAASVALAGAWWLALV